MSDQPCPCGPCVRAGCTRPVVTLAANRFLPQRELHGFELQKFYDGQDAKNAILRRVAEDLMKQGIRAQRGDEPR